MLPYQSVYWLALPVKGANLCALHALPQALSAAKPLTKPAGFAGTTNLRRFFERERLPAGVAVVGDAVCAFNPVSSPPIAALHSSEGLKLTAFC